jgi:hypothetical protein
LYGFAVVIGNFLFAVVISIAVIGHTKLKLLRHSHASDGLLKNIKTQDTYKWFQFEVLKLLGFVSAPYLSECGH